MNPPEVEADVQELLRKWESEVPTTELPLTEEQRDWLVRCIYIFQAHERGLRRSASHKDKIFTEAMVKYIMQIFEKSDAGELDIHSLEHKFCGNQNPHTSHDWWEGEDRSVQKNHKFCAGYLSTRA